MEGETLTMVTHVMGPFSQTRAHVDGIINHISMYFQMAASNLKVEMIR